MLAKWIVCRTTPETRRGFGLAQRAWQAIAPAPGFLGQLGGFAGDDAHILGLWQDDGAHDTFMETAHRSVVERKRQSDFYTSIRVDLLHRRFDMPGRLADLTRAAGAARFLRIADCTVRNERIESFVVAQREIWLPGMADAPGMLAGAFWSCPSGDNRFVVTTLWDGEGSHARYVEQRLPSLRARARPQDDLRSIDGVNLALLDDWTVAPGPRG